MKNNIFECALVVSLLLLAAGQGSAQPAVRRYSATTGDVSLSGAGTKFTIQQPATNANLVVLEAATIYCSVACDLTQSQNGTAASTTAGTVSLLLPFGVPALATVWTASNVGNGTAAGGILHLQATERVTIGLSSVSMGNTGTATNYTFVISSITGTANITLVWSER
jgi:hypothetical protein